jgi:ABC-type nitrate/sulfonate/bicarbonate transport system permease component
MPRFDHRLLWGLTGPVALIVGWQALMSCGWLDFEFFPALGEVLDSVIVLLRTGELPAAVAHTVSMTALAVVVALTLGTAFGLAIALTPGLAHNAMASIDFLRSIPAVALIPVVVVALGPGPAAELILAGYAALWPVVLNTAGGLAAVHQHHYDVGHTLHLSYPATLGKIVLPAALPTWLVGARMAAVIALLVSVVTEMMVYPRGLGGGIIESMHALAPARMWAYALMCGVVGVVINAALRFGAERLVAGSTTGRSAHPGATARGAAIQPSTAPIGLLPLVAMLVVWQLVSAPDSIVLPPPSEWFRGLAGLHRDGVLVSAFAQTVSTYLLGLTAAVVIGAALGMAVGRSSFLDRCLTPTIDFIAAIPGAAIVPAAVVLLGPSTLGAVAVVAFIAAWPILLSTATVMRAIPAARIEMARSVGLSASQRWRKVVLPSIRPGIALGARLASALALIITLLVDMIGTGTGVGRLLMISQQHFDAPAAWGLLTLVGIFGYLVSLLLTQVERRARRADTRVRPVGEGARSR